MIQPSAFMYGLIVVGACTSLLGVCLAIAHFTIEILARLKHSYKHTTSEFLLSFMVYMDVFQIFFRAIPVMLNYYNGSWKIGAAMCYIVVFFIELLPAENLFSLCLLVYSSTREIPIRLVGILIASTSVVVVLFSIPMLMKAEHKDHFGNVHCYVEDDWSDHSWMNYETYIVTYAVIFLLTPCILSLIMAIKVWKEKRNIFLLVLVSSFCVSIIPRLICEMIFVINYSLVNINVWMFVHFLGIFRLCSIPLIYLFHPLTIPRYLNVINRESLGSSLTYTYCSDNQTLVPQHQEDKEDDNTGADEDSFDDLTSARDQLTEDESSPPENCFLVNIE